LGCFKGGKEGTLWYYQSLLNTLEVSGRSSIVDELDDVVSMLERLVEEDLPKYVTGQHWSINFSMILPINNLCALKEINIRKRWAV
jgi:hypothetical protein